MQLIYNTTRYSAKFSNVLKKLQVSGLKMHSIFFSKFFINSIRIRISLISEFFWIFNLIIEKDNKSSLITMALFVFRYLKNRRKKLMKTDTLETNKYLYLGLDEISQPGSALYIIIYFNYNSLGLPIYKTSANGTSVWHN